MKSPKSFWMAIAATTVATLGAPWLACAQTAPVRIPLDREQSVGGVMVGCTGIGQEKDNPRWNAYPIRVEASNPAGDLLANFALAVSGKGGGSLATVSCAGPWIMLKPPAGDYTLDGWIPGSALKHQSASVSPPATGQRVVAMYFRES